MTQADAILPGATLGVLGGGQLGRMFTLAARTMGYRVVVLDPDPLSPAGALADAHIKADYHDSSALAALAAQCAAVTTEFENVPAEALEQLAAAIPVRPSPQAVATAQHRIREKTFLRERGFPTAAFAPITDPESLRVAQQTIPFPAILKTATFGYDGKGQVVVETAEALPAAFESLGRKDCILEQRIDLALEVSVIIARSVDGTEAVFPVAENSHVRGILDTSVIPARIAPAVAEAARALAGRLADALEYCGVLAVELFVSRTGELLINEIAPRPHNSGHYTLDATATTQFEQQVRTLCGLPPGDPRLLSPVVMLNLLGDLWKDGAPPPWDQALAHPGVNLHLYGKHEARVGRKMGHVNCLGETLEAALALADTVRADLGLHQPSPP